MEKTKKVAIPLDYFRGLLQEQLAKCAITGIPLDPKRVNADHITPLSRQDLNPSTRETNVWLVDKRVNALKGNLTYDELVSIAKLIVEHEHKSRTLLKKIEEGQISPLSKPDFDNWIREFFDEDGVIREVH